VPVVIAYRAAVGAREKGQQRLLASHLLRATQSHTGVPEGVSYSAAVEQRVARSTSRPYISLVCLHLLRARQHHAIVPEAVIWRAGWRRAIVPVVSTYACPGLSGTDRPVCKIFPPFWHR